METLQTILNYALPCVGGLTVGAILIAIASVVFRAFVNKAINKINVEALEKKAVDSGLKKIQTITFKHSLEPIAKSELLKVNEKSIEFIMPVLEKLDKKYDSIINCLSKFYSYFDNSVGVPEEKKQALKTALEEANNINTEVKEVVSEVIIAEDTPETSDNGKNKKTITVER